MKSSDHYAQSKMSRHRKPAVWSAILAALTAFACIAAAGAMAKPTQNGTSLQQDVDALVAAGVPGTVLLVRNGNKTTRLTAGVADLTTQRAMQPGDRFKIASLTKTYTATVVLQLVAEGKLRLNDSVERWLPGLVPNGRNITIHQLLNHTSGLFDHELDPRIIAPYLKGDLGHYWAPIQLVRMAVSHKPNFAPGATKFASYSSTNYIIAGLIIEAVTGKSIGAELRSRLFQPLGLTATTYPTRRVTGPLVHGYMVLGQPPAADVTGVSPSLSPASGAIVSDAADVADFYRALLSGRLLRPGLLQAMQTTLPQRKFDIRGQRYGLGLMRFPMSCGTAWGHNGAWPGYYAFALTSANGRRQAVLMFNKDVTSLSPDAGSIFLRLLDKAYCSTA